MLAHLSQPCYAPISVNLLNSPHGWLSESPVGCQDNQRVPWAFQNTSNLPLIVIRFIVPLELSKDADPPPGDCQNPVGEGWDSQNPLGIHMDWCNIV